MRAAALALLAPTAAAPAPADITEAATCMLPRAETEAAFRALPLIATEDDTEADERGTLYTFGEAKVLLAVAERIKFSDYADPKAGTATQIYETVTRGDYADYADFHTVMLGGFGKDRCDRESERSCGIDLPSEGAWRKTLTFAQPEPRVMIFTCTFSKG